MLSLTRIPDNNGRYNAKSVIEFTERRATAITMTVKEVHAASVLLMTSNQPDVHLVRMGEVFAVSSDITLTVLAINGNQVRLGINAPERVSILRADARRRHNGQAMGRAA